MSNININYSLTNDYTGINSPVFISIMNIYNLILLPVNNQDVYNFKINDIIRIIDKTNNVIISQSVVFSTGYVELSSQRYYYFYIANGIKKNNHDYAIILDDKQIDLVNNLYATNSAKLLIGSLILEDSYSYMFDKSIPLLANIDNNYIKFNFHSMINKYNFYKALTNTTVLFVLDTDNFDLLYKLNSDYNSFLIRPLFYKNFPLGSLSLKLSEYNGVSNKDITEFKVFVNDKSYYINSSILNINNLVSGQYTIKIIDRIGLLNIDYLNGQKFDSKEFIIDIMPIKDKYNLDTIALPIPRENKSPRQGLVNLMINLDHNQSFELLGPNNFYKLYSSGYQSLYNMSSGDYVIKYKDKLQHLSASPNEIIHIP